MELGSTDELTGVVLAGGRATRMGGEDKGLIPLRGRPMAAHVAATLNPQVSEVLINANRNHDAYRTLGYRVIPDVREGFLGPLAGMLSGLEAAATAWVLFAPCDTPLIPGDLAPRLRSRLESARAEICVAHDGERAHPVIVLMRRDLAPSMRAFLDAGERKIDRWFAEHASTYADFSDVAHTLVNVNAHSDLHALDGHPPT